MDCTSAPNLFFRVKMNKLTPTVGRIQIHTFFVVPVAPFFANEVKRDTYPHLATASRS
jgi:hypothetical protein